MELLSISDLEFIKESLKYTKEKFENYNYNDPELRKSRILEVEEVQKKISLILKEMRENR